MRHRKVTLTEKERKIIQWVSTLSDKELFGLECLLAGTKVVVQENLTDIDQFSSTQMYLK